ncbi:MAG: hypothetical protein IPL46_27115 [Saprospiraceae bacterium]|nr:hypothetical protein [Saprospiraceae bacterium]
MKSKYFIILILFIFVEACYENPFISDEVTSENDQYPGVDRMLWSHFQTFEIEAAKRRILVDLATENILGSLTDLSGTHVAGQCTYNYNQPNKITIDLPIWNNASHLRREMIVFHELGHCFLSRDHHDVSFSNGLCKSIMRSGTCCCQDAYTQNNRAYYLDELFGIMETL